MTSPYLSPQTSTPPHRVTILDCTRLVMPRVCVSCGESGASLLEYTQDHIPLVLPGIGFVRSTPVAIPYCEAHARRFQLRFSRLRIAQGLAYVLAVVAGCALFFPPVSELLQHTPGGMIAAYVLAGTTFAFLVASIFIVKPFLYDVFVVHSGYRICFKGGVSAFRESLRDTNPGNVAEA